MPEFVGREALMGEVWEVLGERGLILVGARRVGKSTLLQEMSAHPRAGFDLRIVDLQGTATLDEGITRICRALFAESAPSRLASRVEEAQVAGLGLRLRPDAVEAPWLRLEQSLSSVLDSGDPSTTLVVALDEVPWWLDELERGGAGAARGALARLRYLALDARFRSTRWVLTGSVGLAGRAAAWHASAELNHLDLRVVPPLDPAAGGTLFETEVASAGRGATPDAPAAATALAGGIPHWIRALAERCRATGRGDVDVAAVEREAERMLGTQMRHLFQEEGEDHFARRFPPEERRVVSAVLDALSGAPGPLPRLGLVATAIAAGATPDVARQTILRLVDDFYLCEIESDRLAFLVPLFGRWWRRWGR